MDITVYLPDELATRAKREEVNLSRMLRNELVEEFQRRDAMSATLDSPQTYELTLENEDGETYIGRVTGTELAEDGYVTAYLTEDERVLVYDESRSRYEVLQEWDIEGGLRNWLRDDEAYASAMSALGRTPVIDL